MLPSLPYTPTVQKRNVVEFRGLDRRDGAPEGSLVDSTCLSTVRYPFLSTRYAMSVADLSGADDIYEWDGRLVACLIGNLVCDNTVICQVTEGKKQWAVVSGRLIVYPDKIMVEYSDGEYTVTQLEADVAVGETPGGVQLTPTSITAPIRPKIKKNVSGGMSGFPYGAQGYPSVNYDLWVYGKDVDAVTACCDGGVWDLDELSGIEVKAGLFTQGSVDRFLELGDIFIPKITSSLIEYQAVYGDAYGNLGPYYPANPDRTQYNSDGYYCVVTGYWTSDTGDGFETAIYRTATVIYDVYKANVGAPVLSSVFSVNDAVSVTGTPAGISDIEHAMVRSISEEENALYFDDNTFTVPEAYVTLTEPMSVQNIFYLRYNGKDYRTSSDFMLEAGMTLYIMTDGATKITVFRNGEIIGELNATVTDTPEYDRPQAINLLHYVDNLGSVHITRDVPDLDYICESGNRLWGVSNEERTIFASALGDPKNFYDSDGLDTEAYQVAVGSKGDWTGICAYGGGVCCWKEHMLHKVIGSYPSEYYMADYHIEGVAVGSQRSLTVINEALYYVGATGVYSYTGGTPSRIGDQISPSPMLPPRNTVGGSDGRFWYLSGTRWDGTNETLVFDSATGLWIKDNTDVAVAIILHDRKLHILNKDGDIAIVMPETWDPNTLWTAEFAPFDETAVIRKYYMRLDLRLDMTAGSNVKVYVSEDGGEWRAVHDLDSEIDVAKRVSILPRRCDRFAVKITGKGNVTLRAMTREFLAGSERV